jgi:hypothetical protein
VSAPTSFVVTRWRCSFCAVTRSSKSGAKKHIERCWYNPAVRSCKTCANYEPAESDPETGYHSDEWCHAGVELPGYPLLPLHCPKWEVIHHG